MLKFTKHVRTHANKEEINEKDNEGDETAKEKEREQNGEKEKAREEGGGEKEKEKEKEKEERERGKRKEERERERERERDVGVPKKPPISAPMPRTTPMTEKRVPKVSSVLEMESSRSITRSSVAVNLDDSSFTC